MLYYQVHMLESGHSILSPEQLPRESLSRKGSFSSIKTSKEFASLYA